MRRPLLEEIQISATSAFDLLSDRRFFFFLDSGMDPNKLGRYSFIGCDPFLVFSSRGDKIIITRGQDKEVRYGNPFDTLGEFLGKYRLDSGGATVPFTGGAVGYLSYDLGHFIESLPAKAVDDLELPECYFGFYDVVLAFDNLDGGAYLISTGFPELEETKRTARAQRRLEAFKTLLNEGSADELITEHNIPTRPVTLTKGFTRSQYLAAVEKARQYIINGDIFEVNLSQRFEAETKLAPCELYRRLRRINPAPFAAYLGFDEVAVVSASPERFLRLQGDLVETRPIKGTRPRGGSREEDEALARDLRDSSKDRAENIMIVDLERNDLGRLCRYGSVKVSEMAILEVFPTVFHLTSTVVGQLREDKTAIDLLKATFPGGSITGAPKIRAMEIIDELEPTRRSVYTGSVGYLGFDDNLDLNIAIRTFITKDNKAYFQVGGAVTYDSDPAKEYQETLDKAQALFRALSGEGIG